MDESKAGARRVGTAALLGAAAGAFVFVASALAQLRGLVVRQPPHDLGSPMPPDATGFPVAAAWVFAAPYGGLAFVTVLVVAALLLPRKH
jgi:hypothetical protein